MNRGFGSDNHSGIHPKIFKAIEACNQGHAPSYGTDQISLDCEKLFQKEFGDQAKVFFVFNGTAANILSLQASTQSHNAIIASESSHLNMDECGAPEFFTGGKLRTVPSPHGKMSLEQIQSLLIRRGDQHFSQAKIISLTQPTELGTCYSLSEIKNICDWAHQEKLYVHIDGARIANAAYHLKTTFKKMISETGVDILSFGGTKNGLMMGEAVVILNPLLAENFKFIRKQSAQLPSKTRFLAAQFQAYLENETWRQIAEHACEMAQYFHQELSKIPGLTVTEACESNAVFVKIPKPWIKALREQSFFYVWDEKTFECRLMTSWDTERQEIDTFVALAKKLSQEKPHEASASSIS
jgi:threonine aldolase